MDRTSTIEALKELGRVVLLAVVPVVIVSMEQGTINWKVIGVSVAIAALRAIDKWMHEYGIEEKDKSMSKGLTRF